MEAQEAGERVIESAPMTRLHKATINGDVNSFIQLLSEHPMILDMERCYLKQSSLHVAIELGHLEFANQILHQKPQLAEKLDADSEKKSPLHISSEKGYLEMVEMLLPMSPSMCLARDRDGRNPLHLAAIQGHKDVIGVLLRAMPQAARERTTSGDTILHLCVKHCQLETLKFLIEEMDDVGNDLLQSTDNDGNTLLHLAVFAKQPPMVEYLVKKKGISKNARNKNGITAMDICKQSNTMNYNQLVIFQSLSDAKALCAKQVAPVSSLEALLGKLREGLMVAASLIAAMAFQFGINPPGGTWQDDNDGHIAGQSILPHKDPHNYNLLLASNTTAMCSSLFAIISLTLGFPYDRRSAIILTLDVIIAVYATFVSYVITVTSLYPHFTGSKIALYSCSIILLVTFIVWGLLHVLGVGDRFVKQIKYLR